MVRQTETGTLGKRQCCSSIVVWKPITSFQAFGQERSIYQFFCQRLFWGKEIQFPLYQPLRQSNAPAKLLKVLAPDRFCVRQLHALLEQSFIKSEDARHTQMETGIDEVVCWSEMIFPITAIDEWEVLQVGIIIEGEIVEHDDTSANITILKQLIQWWQKKRCGSSRVAPFWFMIKCCQIKT